jgi:hypothetical protein
MSRVERWCIHIPGPDDLYAMRSREEAERTAAEHNEKMDLFIATRPPNPNYPSRESVMAVVIEWPHGEVSNEEWERLCAEDES